jgi:hypothetical protein
VFIFLDEAGDMGFDFENKKPSRYFVIAIITCDVKKPIEIAIKRTLAKVNAYLKNPLPELKGTKLKIKFKEFFLKQLTDKSLKIYCAVLDKQALENNIENLPPKDRLYNIISKRVLEQISFQDGDSPVILMVDRSKRIHEINIFNQYIKSHLEGRLPLNVKFDIFHDPSHGNKGLQAVDLFCHGIYRKYEHNDSSWYDLFKGYIASEMIYRE